jgi:phage-related protein
MPIDISAAAIIEKNRLSSSGVWLPLLEITLAGTGEEIDLCRNTDDVSWPLTAGGEVIPGVTKVYTAFPLEIDEVSESSDGEVPRLAVRVSNVSGVMWQPVDRSGGFRNALVRIMFVHSAHLDNATPEIDLSMRCARPDISNQWATFFLSTRNRYNKSFPKGRMMGTFCRYPDFGGDRCGFNLAAPGYDGLGCDRSKSRCKALRIQEGDVSRLARFGGTPGVGESARYD